jgi:hypothetical protein
MKTLFLVHIEEMFRDHFPDRMYVPRIQRAMTIYDQVYVMSSHVMHDGPIREIQSHCLGYQEIDWGWGYEPDQFEGHEVEQSWIIESSGPHDYTWVPPELRCPDPWNQMDISVGGGCRSECLADFICVLDHQRIRHRLVEGYIY